MIALAKPLFDVPAMPQDLRNEWYTPVRYVEAARRVMGGIDLDPASCDLANRTVKAARYYTMQENGLAQRWYGRVWLNPPYGRTEKMKAQGKSTIEFFSLKLLKHYYACDVEQAIFLGTSQVDARWFQLLWEFPICFVGHKIHFNMPFQRSSYSHMFGTIFAYLGPNEQKFVEVFSAFGTIAKRISEPHKKAVPLNLWEVSNV